jgi:hypothetical protein
MSLIQGHTHDLIDQEFSVWAAGERKWRIESFHKLGKFITNSFQKKKTSFTILRRLYDWTSYFADTLLTINHFTTARVFRFCKENNKVVMYYKTNMLENEWCGFVPSGENQQYGIQICHMFKQEPPNAVVPEDLPQSTTTEIATNPSMTKWFDQVDQKFWDDIQRDSIAYLTRTNFEKEGILK